MAAFLCWFIFIHPNLMYMQVNSPTLGWQSVPLYQVTCVCVFVFLTVSLFQWKLVFLVQKLWAVTSNYISFKYAFKVWHDVWDDLSSTSYRLSPPVSIFSFCSRFSWTQWPLYRLNFIPGDVARRKHTLMLHRSWTSLFNWHIVFFYCVFLLCHNIVA